MQTQNVEIQTRIDALQRQLAIAKQQNDTKIEIETLVEIGKLAPEVRNLDLANTCFDLASKAIRNSGQSLDILNEVLGAQALILRRMKQYPESLKLFREAAQVAQEQSRVLAYATWVGRQGDVHRLMDDPVSARKAYETARDLFSALGDQGRSGLAEQEGNLGLLASDSGDLEVAEKCYRRTLEMALASNDRELVKTWATNLGNVLTRKRFYHEAWSYYSQAMDAAVALNDEARIVDTAKWWRASYGLAYRWLEAADMQIDTARQVSEFMLKFNLLRTALRDLWHAGAWSRVVELGNKLRWFMDAQDPRLKLVMGFRDGIVDDEDLIADAEESLRPIEPTSVPEPGTETTLCRFVVMNMSRYEEASDTDGMAQVAHLICDAGLGLMDARAEAWKTLLPDKYLSLPREVIEDAMLALCRKHEPEKSLEISLRYKSLSFCLPNIKRLRENGAPHDEAAAYLKALQNLSEAVTNLRGWDRDGVQRTEDVRAAGEALLECGERLRKRDPILHAKLGGLVHPSDLIDAFPLHDPVAILDLFATPSGTIIHILYREGKDVRVLAQIVPNFTKSQVAKLLTVWLEHRVSQEISVRQREGLLQISKKLHDQLTCKLAQELAEWGVTQVVFIPDLILAPLPLHLGSVCANDIHIPGVPTEDATFFGEVFPVEYAPCLQAVAVSQYQRRPRNLATVLSFADPKLDLPGAASFAEWLQSQLGDTLHYVSYRGGEATFANLEREVDKADLVILSTHGDLDLAHPADSHLVFADRNWTLSEMLESPTLASHPAVILSACEIGTTLPGGIAASSIPGALLSAGADFVLAALWPVENMSMAYLIERFLAHLSHKGYRPSAALFRAVRDLKKLSKDEIVGRCRVLLDQMVQDGTADRFPEQYVLLDNLVIWLEDSQTANPFASAQFWGSLVIVGSGWHSPAGAIVGGPQMIMKFQEALAQRKMAQTLMLDGKFGEARPILEELLAKAEGLERVRTLDMLAEVIWRGRNPSYEQSTKRESLELLDEAERLARSEDDEQLLRNIQATRQKMNL